MATSSSSWHTLKRTTDTLEVYTKTWEPSATPRAHIAFLHGFSDRIDHYDAFFTKLTTAYPIRVHSWDRPGWGKSVHNPAERGDTGTMGEQIHDLNEYLAHIVTLIPDLEATPLFLMGHSMGGQEAAYYMLHSGTIANDVRPKIKAFILESPYIGLDAASTPSSFKVFFGKLGAGLFPKVQIPNPLKVEYICPDKAVQKMYSDDPLCHNRGTLVCFRDMLERAAELTALGKGSGGPPVQLEKNLSCPVFWTHGTADKATDYPTSKMLCDSLQPYKENESNKIFKSYEGWLHQLHNEPNGGQEQYAKDVGEFAIKVAREKY